MHRVGLTLLILGLLAVAASYGAALVGVAAHATPWWLASGSTAVLAALAVLGAARGRRPTPILTATGLVSFLSVATGLLVPLAMRAPDASTPLLLGLPRPTAILLLLVGLLPLLLLPVAYAAAFEREVLSDEDLARLRSGSGATGAADAVDAADTAHAADSAR